jgi:hypothetical protein
MAERYGADKRMQQGTSDMLIARQGEEIVCPKGTVCGQRNPGQTGP